VAAAPVFHQCFNRVFADRSPRSAQRAGPAGQAIEARGANEFLAKHVDRKTLLAGPVWSGTGTA